MASNKYCVIMAGGIGSRFWPKSRQSMPKQFLDILGTGKSFIRHTYERFAKIVPAGNFLVVTNHKYKDLVLQHIPEIGEKQVLCEPIGRNTAPCIAYAAYTLLRENPDAEMIVTPSDHLILNEDDFRTIIGECLEFADRHDALLTVGIKPTRPDTGYGYIQVSDDHTISKVKCFTEKPDLELAQTFLADRRVLLEFGYLHLEGAGHRRGLPQIPARAPCHVQRRDEGAGHRCREDHRGDRLLGVPRHLDRLRHHGKGRQRLCPLRRLRLERRRHMGLGLPARPQRPLRQRRPRRGVLPSTTRAAASSRCPRAR